MGTMTTVPRVMAPNSPAANPSKVIGWHFDFVLRVGALANNATILLDLVIPPGAPFCLRGIGGYDVVPGEAAPPTVVPLTDAFIAFTDQTDNWLQTQQIGTTGDWSTGGQDALYEPVYNQVTYGPNSVIQVRVTNLSGAGFTDAYIVFRGTKLYYQDLIYTPTYPDRYNGVPYLFPIQWPIDPNALPNITIGASRTIRDIRIQPKGADFVFRGGTMALIEGSNADVRLLFRDQWGRPYASDFIHWQWLLSNDLAQRPGIFYPEIYIPKDRILLVDVQQNEAATAVMNLVLNGQRVFPK